MCSKISWSEFISFIFFISTIYYIAIIILYYRKDILKWSTHGFQFTSSDKKEVLLNSNQRENLNVDISSNQNRPMSYNEMTVASIEEPLRKSNPTDVHELIEELKKIFSNPQQKKIIKQELILTIHNKLGDYKQLKGTEIEKEIIQHIAKESKEKCAIDLNKEELEDLWKL